MSEKNREIAEDLEEEGDFTNELSSLKNQNEDGFKTFGNTMIPKEWDLKPVAEAFKICDIHTFHYDTDSSSVRGFGLTKISTNLPPFQYFDFSSTSYANT